MSGQCKKCGYDGCVCDSTDTPETDEIWNNEWNHAYLFSRMRKLERERDEAKSELVAEHALNCGLVLELDKAKSERDEARRVAENWRMACFNLTPSTELIDFSLPWETLTK